MCIVSPMERPSRSCRFQAVVQTDAGVEVRVMLLKRACCFCAFVLTVTIGTMLFIRYSHFNPPLNEENELRKVRGRTAMELNAQFFPRKTRQGKERGDSEPR